MPLVSSGVEHGNLRELALARMKDLGTQCRDVRTREVGIQEIHHKVRPYQGIPEIPSRRGVGMGLDPISGWAGIPRESQDPWERPRKGGADPSGLRGQRGWETFLSYEDPEQDILVGLLRLRKSSPESFRPELKGGVSVVRELHVYGSVVPVSSRDPSKFQHQGFGMLLMEEAERIAREEHGARKIAVISVAPRAWIKLGFRDPWVLIALDSVFPGFRDPWVLIALDSDTHGFRYPWVLIALDSDTHGFRYPWVLIALDSDTHGFRYPWVLIALDSNTHGFRYPWVLIALDSNTHGFRYPWVLIALDSVIPGFRYPWVLIALDSDTHGFRYPWVLIALDSDTHGFRYPWVLIALDSDTHGFRYPWVLIALDSVFPGFCYPWMLFSLDLFSLDSVIPGC
ncbi:hypothetical protein DUI87_35453 [Hirundo rustica rustica]|uniref:Uncharacterized protein n=1 Tax=Hirundo rustica rustica TaxID=333673 RepID=A0A3M0J0L8_HIRRU|nr:hypothetical protein DUI87_35453 [Hirundo rustica rustica]